MKELRNYIYMGMIGIDEKQKWYNSKVSRGKAKFCIVYYVF